MSQTPDQATSREFLQKAAECYIKAGWATEACRIWEQIADYQQAGQCYEQLGNWKKAGQCYEQLGNWQKAGQCYLQSGQTQAALTCWQKAGQPLQAAWVLADQLQQTYQVQAVLQNFAIENETQALEIELITARWEAGIGKEAQSAQRLRKQLEPLLSILTPRQRHLYEWSLKIAQIIKRPDLSALIYATGYRAKLPKVCQEWEKWAIDTFGSAAGVPTQEEESLSYEYEVISVNSRGEIIQRVWQQAKYFKEPLGNGIEIEMVYIPGGTFIMGAPENEKQSYSDERPQHQVKVAPFHIGKYPITQAQWQAVAQLSKIERDLDPDPSHFKGENRPVEQVSWHDAVEFCARVSKATGKSYRLPSEAEWEYACRAGTSTAFHFGKTITSELANYHASSTYASEAPGEFRGETTPVGSFLPNNFGLYDLHGNVREWCADPWHSNYEGAPGEGRVWTENGDENRYHVLRGGSWSLHPRNCRSAYRGNAFRRVNLIDRVGFRVCCGVGRT